MIPRFRSTATTVARRGKWHNLSCPMNLSDSPVEVKRSPMLGVRTDGILAEVLECGGTRLRHSRRLGRSRGPDRLGV